MSVREVPPPPLPIAVDEALPFRRRAAVIDGHRVHFIDHGEGPAVLLVHGNPTWSYLWRKVIARLEGLRVIAPDLVGFGLSDKPRSVHFHQLDTHVRIVEQLVDLVDPGPLTVVGQDWGGPVAAGVGARRGARACVFGNTSILAPKRFLATPFHRFSHLPLISEAVFYATAFPVPILDRVQGDRASIGPAEKRAYKLPFARLRDRAGPLALARMVPNRATHPSNAVLEEIDAWARAFEGPRALVWGTRDPILGRALKRHREAFSEAGPEPLVTVTEAGHFSQEEIPDEWAAAIRAVQ